MRAHSKFYRVVFPAVTFIVLCFYPIIQLQYPRYMNAAYITSSTD